MVEVVVSNSAKVIEVVSKIVFTEIHEKGIDHIYDLKMVVGRVPTAKVLKVPVDSNIVLVDFSVMVITVDSPINSIVDVIKVL